MCRKYSFSILVCACFAACSEQPATPTATSASAVMIHDTLPSATVDTPQAATAPVEKNIEKAAASAFDIDYIMGKFDPAKHPDFVTIEARHASEAGMRLRSDAYEAFKKMAAAAAKEGIVLKIISATRPFNRQKSIWEQKWNGQRLVNGGDLSKTTPDHTKRALTILEYSSMPGTSRHHWGTDIDLNNLSNAHFATGAGKKMYEWLAANAAEYGYCQPYTPHGPERPHGYNEEKWHWSYMPISAKLTELARQQLKNDMISGFDGAATAPKIDVVNKYVLGINKACH